MIQASTERIRLSPSRMSTTLGLVMLAVAGCLLGRVLGPRLKLCPYRLSAQIAAALPILVGLMALDSAGALRAILIGVGAVVGVFAGGHATRLRALAFCFLGSGLGGLIGGRLG